MSKQFKE
jgi:hypothetical protein